MSTKKILLVVVIFLIPVIALFGARICDQPTQSMGDILAQYGFLELNPPSTLAPPGTWVTLIEDKPLRLGVICSPEGALGAGISGKLLDSSSANLELVSKLDGSFKLEGSTMSIVQSSLDSSKVKDISFKLMNVRILELPDEAIFEGLNERTGACRDAIEFRLGGEQIVSMIKSVLMADVEYQIHLKQELEGSSMISLKEKLALELDLVLEDEIDESSSLKGKNLIWGVRDDSIISTLGLGLPSTGNPLDVQNFIEDLDSVDRGVLLKRGGVAKVVQLREEVDSPAESQDAIVSYKIRPVMQRTKMGCWAAAYTMMKSWKDKTDYPIKQALNELGDPWIGLYLSDSGLPVKLETDFMKAAGLETEPPASYTVGAFKDLLEKHGPLWIINGDGINAHARLVVGMRGGLNEDGSINEDGLEFEIIDPKLGEYWRQPLEEFIEDFEGEARWVVDGRFDRVDQRRQIIHWPAKKGGTGVMRVGGAQGAS